MTEKLLEKCTYVYKYLNKTQAKIFPFYFNDASAHLLISKKVFQSKKVEKL